MDEIKTFYFLLFDLVFFLLYPTRWYKRLLFYIIISLNNLLWFYHTNNKFVHNNISVWVLNHFLGYPKVVSLDHKVSSIQRRLIRKKLNIFHSYKALFPYIHNFNHEMVYLFTITIFTTAFLILCKKKRMWLTINNKSKNVLILHSFLKSYLFFIFSPKMSYYFSIYIYSNKHKYFQFQSNKNLNL